MALSGPRRRRWIRLHPAPRAGTQTSRSPPAGPRGEAGCASASCLGVEDPDRGARGVRAAPTARETPAELRPVPGLASPRPGSRGTRWAEGTERGGGGDRGSWSAKAPASKGLSPHLWGPRTAGKKGPHTPSVRRSRELRSKRLKIISPHSQG